MRSSLIIRGALAALFVGLWSLFGLMAQGDKRPVSDLGLMAQEDSKRPVSDLTKEIINELTEEERRGLRAAVNEVWQADEVEKRRQDMLEANLAYRKALQAEIGRMDVTPKVRSILMRLLQSRFKAEGKGGGVGPRNPQSKPIEYTAEEKAIITNARLKSEKLPAVIEAQRKLDGAVTARERNVASGNFRKVMRAAMEKTDPRVKQIFGRRDRPRAPERRKPSRD